MNSEIASRKRAHGYTETSLNQGNPVCPECGSMMQLNDYSTKARCRDCDQEYRISKIARVFVKEVDSQ